MLEFRTIERGDRDMVNKHLALSDFRACEYSFSNNLAWHRNYNMKMTFFGGFYLVISGDDDLRLTFPAGKGDLRAVVSEMKKYFAERNLPLKIGSIDEYKLSVLNELFPGEFTLIEDRDGYDYIYEAANLAELKGRKYHSKRNHLKKAEGYEYSPLTEKDFDDCIEFSARLYNSRNGIDVSSEKSEQLAIHTFFENFDYLGMSGGVLRADGRVIAFTVGDRLNSDTADIHIEKADTSYEGAYAAVNCFYARQLAGKFKYINREEDMGIEGLRKSKLSYHPAFLQIKNIAVFK